MEKNYFKTIDVRSLGEVDVFPLIQLLPKLMAEWDKESDYELNVNKMYSLSQVLHINFRWSDKNKEPVEYQSLELWETYKSVLLPIMQKAVQPIGYKKGYFPRVMLAKMHPGTSIRQHIDGHTKGWIAHKIHIPLITNDKVQFFVKGKEYNFKKGMAYEVNNGAKHGAFNGGETARIHLIFEYLDADINDVPGNDLPELQVLSQKS
ncbi:hypothetical protein BH09BAC6_BH09BAC6_11800 [soil metagenome]|jgi:hypothetical protein